MTRPFRILGSSVLAACLVVLTSVLVAGPSLADDAPSVRVRENEVPPFEDFVDVQLVNVEVYVTDRRGRPVTGLGVDDFEVLEDGEPVAISHFAEMGAPPSDGADGSGGVEVPTEAPGDGARAAADPASVAEPPHLVVYVDNVHLRTAGRKRLIEDLRAYLLGGPVPAERVLIVSQSPGLQVEAPFGSTASELDEALEALDATPAMGHEHDREQQLLFGRLYEIYAQAQSSPFLDPCEELSNAGVREVDSYVQRVRGRVSTTLGHLASLTSALAGVPGLKALFYVGDGLELVPGTDMFHFLSETCTNRARDIAQLSQRTDLTGRFEQLARHANANRVSFFTLEATGLISGSSASVELADRRFAPSGTNDQVRRANLQNSLAFLADYTGGRAVFNANRFDEALEDIDRDLTSFYSLAYTPDHSGDDLVHRIEVRLPEHKRVRVRHRLSYRDKAADERMADRLQTALTLGREDNPLGASLEHGRIVLPEGRRKIYEVPLRVTVPLERLVFLPQDGGAHVGRLRLQLAARDTEGRVAAFHQKHFEVELDPSLDGEPRGRHTFIVDVEMRGGEHVVAVAVRDELGRETSYLASRLVVEATADVPATSSATGSR